MNKRKAKSEERKIKTQTLKFLVLKFVFALLALRFTPACYALNLDKIKALYLSLDYKGAILEGEKMLATNPPSSQLQELYYLLGLSYMKDGNLLRASDIFEIIINEYKNSLLKEDAKLSLADTFFLRGDLQKAQAGYKEIIESNPNSKLKAEVYYRLSRVEFKKGNSQEGKEYLARLKQEFPSSAVFAADKELSSLSEAPASGLYYTVQVGYFSNKTNARNLANRLIQKGYSAYMEETASQGKAAYRVRVGKSSLRQEIVDLASKLSGEGYPTKVFP